MSPRGRGFRRPTAQAGLIVVLATAIAACHSQPSSSGSGTESRQPTDWSKLGAVSSPDPELASLGARQDTYDRLCGRGRGDVFAKALCGKGRRPEIRDMAELIELAGLAQDHAFAFSANSTSLVTKSVTPLNPRAIIFPRVGSDLQPPANLIALGFVRGEQFVEVVSRDPTTDDLNFYLLNFEQDCNYAPGGCDLAGLLTEEIEHKWTAYSVYDQDDLEPTTFDCLSCHRPNGVGSKRILRMQELSSPWMHWFPQKFVQRTDSDRVLLDEFAQTHGVDKQYGGIPISAITNGALDVGSGAQLEALVRAAGYGNQPNPFDGQIATEMKSGTSPTWQARFQAHLAGNAIAVPYPQVDVTDEAKRNAAITSYVNVVNKSASRDTLTDLRTIFSNDAAEKLSFLPLPTADGKTVLTEMCSRCHDGRSNPSLPKSRFNVLMLDKMSREEKTLAVTRITDKSLMRMPPWRGGDLTPAAIQAATAELQK